MKKFFTGLFSFLLYIFLVSCTATTNSNLENSNLDVPISLAELLQNQQTDLSSITVLNIIDDDPSRSFGSYEHVVESDEEIDQIFHYLKNQFVIIDKDHHSEIEPDDPWEKLLGGGDDFDFFCLTLYNSETKEDFIRVIWDSPFPYVQIQRYQNNQLHSEQWYLLNDQNSYDTYYQMRDDVVKKYHLTS